MPAVLAADRVFLVGLIAPDDGADKGIKASLQFDQVELIGLVALGASAGEIRGHGQPLFDQQQDEESVIATV